MTTLVRVPSRKYGQFRVVSDGLPLRANPIETSEHRNIEDVEMHRRMLCVHQASCCTFAAAENWKGFSCLSCFAYSEMTREEQRMDLDGLAVLLYSMSCA